MASGNATGPENSGNDVPQWKRDLIQRRRQQSKVLANNGASVKLCSAVIGPTGAANDPCDPPGATVTNVCGGVCGARDQCGNGGAVTRTRTGEDPSVVVVVVVGSVSSRGGSTCGATSGGTVAANVERPVACNMRLEADVSLCSDSEDHSNGGRTLDMERKSDAEYEFSLESDGFSAGVNGRSLASRAKDSEDDAFAPESAPARNGSAKPDRDSSRTRARLVDIRNEGRSNGAETEATRNGGRAPSEDGESDSSEELQYGPGIVNKLKSKYLNLTLRETNKSRASVQRFRRAASLEDLLDCDEEPGEKSARRYAKRSAAGATVAKAERYRTASRGNDSMKRARSVETLLRYNSASDDVTPHSVPSRFTANAVRREPINDHIVLIDRTTVKIESRLGDADRPKPLNKPKRIKAVLAETERPPTDLVKTTMRIFEGCAKKHKPRGEVAAKVATFKTINDTFKAQNQKKIVPKPPLQPKPFANGTAAKPGSPKKIVVAYRKPTAEVIETRDGREEYRNDGVITEPIARSVSSVVSKFRQIEKSHSPSPSPEPSCKSRCSPIPSPEPPPPLVDKTRVPPESKVMSPPRIVSPASPKRDFFRQTSSSPVRKAPSPNGGELVRQTSQPEPCEPPKPLPQRADKEIPKAAAVPENVGRAVPEIIASRELERKERPASPVPLGEPDGAEDEAGRDIADGTRTIDKAALENIEKAGTTMQFSFNGKPISGKSYLPGATPSARRTPAPPERPATNGGRASASPAKPFHDATSPSSAVVAPPIRAIDAAPAEAVSRLQERLEPEIEEAAPASLPESGGKPIGAISSLGLAKTVTTSTPYARSNESKTTRTHKSDSPSPPQKQIGIIRPLVSTKTQLPQQNLSNRELEKNLINRVKSIEQPTKVVVSLKSSADEIQPAKKSGGGGGGGGGSGSGGLWDTKPWNQQNTMVFNFSNRKDVPDYIENDGLIIRRKRDKPKVGDGGIIVLDATLDASTTDDAEWEISGGPPSPCDVSFLNDNVLINGRSNLSKQPRNHKHRIQFDDTATRTFEYPSESSMLEGESSSVDGGTSGSSEQSASITDRPSPVVATSTNLPSLLGGGGLASYTPSKVDLASEGFELGVTRALVTTTTVPSVPTSQPDSLGEVDYLKPAQDAGAWGSETTADLLF